MGSRIAGRLLREERSNHLGCAPHLLAFMDLPEATPDFSSGAALTVRKWRKTRF
jgi:hypothetical protein